MHSAGDAVGQDHSVVFGIDVVLIGGMSDLVDGGQHGGCDIIRQIFGGNTAVVFADPVGERVLGLVLIAPGGVEMQVCKQLVHERFLLVDRIGLIQEGRVHLLCLDHFLNERDQPFFDLVKEFVVEFDACAGLVVVQHLVVDRRFA